MIASGNIDVVRNYACAAASLLNLHLHDELLKDVSAALAECLAAANRLQDICGADDEPTRHDEQES
jgi:hypothetical protein